MKLAVCHYHLNRGGVTRVIENHLRALSHSLTGGQLEVAILFGGRKEGWPEHLPEKLKNLRIQLCPIDLLEYDDHRAGQDGTPSLLATAIVDVLKQLGFSQEETVIHVHNHSIGKNHLLPEAIRHLAAEGWRFLLQIHDFAEDYRPGNFRHLRNRLEHRLTNQWHHWLYPQAESIHYAILNGRDQLFLQQAGVPSERLHLLPNPVVLPGPLPEKITARQRLQELFGIPVESTVFLYPVRCIRRKNVGEAVFCAATLPPGCFVTITLPPINPREKPRYERWKQFAQENRLPCQFDIGVPGALQFSETLAACDRILTTSIAEGFGMAFLEAWLADRAIVGRDLPEITEDFRQAGMRFPGLCKELKIPAEWIDEDAFRRRLLQKFLEVKQAYGLAVSEQEKDELEQTKLSGKTIDFGDLCESLQEEAIRRAIETKQVWDVLTTLNPPLQKWLDKAEVGEELVAQNRNLVLACYGLEKFGKKLLTTYQAILCSAPQTPDPIAHPEKLLEAFLRPERFRLLRT